MNFTPTGNVLFIELETPIDQDCNFFGNVTQLRFTMICGVGTPIAFLGCIFNLILVCFFLRRGHRDSPTFYFAVLAFLDFIICLSYIFLMGIDGWAHYYRIAWLWWSWVHYCIPILTFEQIAELASPYVLMFATFEEFLGRCGLKEGPLYRCLAASKIRRYIVVLISFCAIALRLSNGWEYQLVYKENCTDPLGRIDVDRTSIHSDPAYARYHMYALPVIQKFVPFFVLILLNCATVHLLRSEMLRRRSERQSGFGALIASKKNTNVDGNEEQPLTDEYTASLAPQAISAGLAGLFEEKRLRRKEEQKQLAKVRGVTYTLVIIVTMYLLCNSLSLFISALEQNRSKLIVDDRGYPTDFYLISTDVISFLVTLNSFVRIFIHLGCRVDLRKEFRTFFFVCSNAKEVDV